jgi:hypothetical protein
MLDYLEEHGPRIQEIIDRWEAQAKLRNYGRIDRCDLKESIKIAREVLAGEPTQHREHIIGCWTRIPDTIETAYKILSPKVSEIDFWTETPHIRDRLCASRNWVPPLDRSKIPKDHCKNTGKPIHTHYRQNKSTGYKKDEVCPCNSCVKQRQVRKWEISEYRMKLSKIKKKKKKDPKRYQK